MKITESLTRIENNIIKYNEYIELYPERKKERERKLEILEYTKKRLEDILS
jgi:hypothetical protein